MRALSNAFMDQVEIIQKDLWGQGPLELVFLKDGPPLGVEAEIHVATWNRRYRAGFFKSAAEVDFVLSKVPGLRERENPNVFVVPSLHGYTELHRMLASVVPERILRRHGLRKECATAWLGPIWKDVHPAIAQKKAKASSEAFIEYLWPRLVRRRGLRLEFSATSPIRLLAADIPFWMNRLYRLALDRWESLGPTKHEDEEWKSLDVLWEELRKQVPEEELKKVTLSRPYLGGTLWLPEDQKECDAVVDDLVDGGGCLESLEPVLEVLNSHRAHEDFSSRYSWVKEDFERSFYSKRSKIRVSLLETVDDLPAWTAPQPDGFENVLFRDILSFLGAKEQHLVIALRHGKTVSQIAQDRGLSGHGAVSRQVKRLKAKVKSLLQDRS